jgi:nucleotide-binding universal stress UspA family protein
MLPNLSPILCAVDLTETSEPVLAHAIALARGLGVPLHVVHAVEPLNQTGRAMLTNVLGEDEFKRRAEDLATAQTELLATRVARFLEHHLPGTAPEAVVAGRHVEHGRPADAILDAAARLDAAMIVLGLQRHSRLTRVMVGSVAQHVVHSSPLPVVLVPLATAET